MKKFNKFYDGYFEQFNFKDQENIYAGFYNNYICSYYHSYKKIIILFYTDTL